MKYNFATIQNVKDDRQTDRQTDRRQQQATHCTIGSTDSTVGQKLTNVFIGVSARIYGLYQYWLVPHLGEVHTTITDVENVAQLVSDGPLILIHVVALPDPYRLPFSPALVSLPALSDSRSVTLTLSQTITRFSMR